MCTYQTDRVTLSGSGKGAGGWFPLSAATVYFDHPAHAPADHTLNVDFINPALGPGARVAVELDPASARAPQPFMAPVRPPTMRRSAKTNTASAGIIDSAAKARMAAVFCE